MRPVTAWEKEDLEMPQPYHSLRTEGDKSRRAEPAQTARQQDVITGAWPAQIPSWCLCPICARYISIDTLAQNDANAGIPVRNSVTSRLFQAR